MKKLIIILVCLFSAGIIMAQEVTLDDLLSKYFKASGHDKFAEIQTIRMTGKMSMQGGGDGPYSLTKKRPDFTREEIEMQGTKMIFAGDGKAGWMIYPPIGTSDPQDMPPELFEINRKDDRSEPYNMFNPFISWKKDGTKIEIVGKEDMNGTSVYNLKMIFNNNDVVNYYIDAVKYVLLRMKEKTMMQGQMVDAVTIYGDFRVIDGITFPYKTENLLNGQSNGVLILDKCEFNIPIEDTIFKKPVVNK